ncbi:hypothetical protein C8J57DRAFT_1034506, partial [Mycena rebaudengoi]
ERHATLTVGDSLNLAQHLNDPLYSPRSTCEFDDCDNDRTLGGCENPHACVAAAATRLGQILPKWIP